MTSITMRQQLHKHIDTLPDELVRQIADFALFVSVRRSISPDYTEWSDEQWQSFALQQFFRDDNDEVTYSLNDAQEVYEA